MSKDDALPLSDQAQGAPHPSAVPRLLGHAQAERALLDAIADERLHHAWLLIGPKGVGKASFAWRAAKYLLATPPVEPGGMFGAPPPPTSLDIDPEHPVVRRIMAGSEPRLMVLRRPYDEKTKRFKQAITVDEARKLKGFFAMSAPDGGRRVVIVDAADEMNTNAANAILKVLEEPPKDVVLLLVNHQPARLLPTIRSRCRTLRFAPLTPDDLATALSTICEEPPSGEVLRTISVLAEGSVGAALSLHQEGGAILYTQIVRLLDTLPRLDRAMAVALANTCAGRDGAARFDLTITLFQHALSRLARRGAMGQALPEAVTGEDAVLARLAPTPHSARAWAEAASTLTQTARRGAAVNLDAPTLVLNLIHALQDTARSAI